MTKIFLHLGPGGNPDIDKNFIKGDIQFYEHSFAKENEQGYINRIINELEAHLKAELNKGKVQVIAHSFSAQLLNNVNVEVLNQLEKITYLAPTFCYKSQLHTFLFNFLTSHKDKELLEKLPKRSNDFSPTILWDIFPIFSKRYPNYITSYLGKEASLEKLISFSDNARPLEETSFVIGNNELLSDSNLIQTPKIETNVELFLGEKDPYFNEEIYNQIESSCKNSKRFKLPDCSHLIHIDHKFIF